MVNSEMAECVYCGTYRRLTHEHLLPICLIERTKHQTEKFLKAANKIIRGEPSIKDVCKDCNNIHLSKLDTYICNLFDEYFNKFVTTDNIIHFNFNYNSLSRWLLKTCYNSKRANNKEDSKYFHQYKNYILEGKPSPRNVFIFLQLIIPYKISEEERQGLSKEFQGLEEMPPDYARIGDILLSNNACKEFFINFVIIKSYLFYIFILKNANSLHRNKKRNFINFIKVNFKNASYLNINDESLILYPSNIDAKQAFETQIFFNQKTYEEWYINNF